MGRKCRRIVARLIRDAPKPTVGNYAMTKSRLVCPTSTSILSLILVHSDHLSRIRAKALDQQRGMNAPFHGKETKTRGRRKPMLFAGNRFWPQGRARIYCSSESDSLGKCFTNVVPAATATSGTIPDVRFVNKCKKLFLIRALFGLGSSGLIVPRHKQNFFSTSALHPSNSVHYHLKN
jgi:hypothetical protein